MSNYSQLLAEAEQFCILNKERLSKPRLEVLKIIASSPKPLGAYEILEALSHVMSKPKPPTAYRAIDFWQKNKFIHKIDSLGAYVVCKAGHLHAGAQFMICKTCQKVIEAHLCILPDALKQHTLKNKFVASHWSIEVHGYCAECVIGTQI